MSKPPTPFLVHVGDFKPDRPGRVYLSDDLKRFKIEEIDRQASR